MPFETPAENLLPTVRDARQLLLNPVYYLEKDCRTCEGGVRECPPTPEECGNADDRRLWDIDEHKPGRSVVITPSVEVFEANTAEAPYRGQVYLQLLRILYAATGVWQRRFVVRVLGPLAIWIQDLPASESYHHAYRYGLLDHALEVALASLTEVGLRIWPRDPSHCGDPALPGRVLRLTIALGLLHDVGKVFEVEVRDEKSGEIWDPLREPLLFFKVRHRIPIFSPTRFQYREKRGLHSHEKRGRNLLAHVLPKPLWKQIGWPLSEVYDCYLERFDLERLERPDPYSCIAYIVQQADGDSTRRAHRAGWSAVTRFQELMETAAQVPWKIGQPAMLPQTADSAKSPVSEREPEATC